MPASTPNHPLLLVLAHGVGRDELDALRGSGRWHGAVPTAPMRLPARPVARVLDDFGAADQLADLGVAVDRRSLLLRPAGRTDATAVDVLGRRPTGPADVTLFEARDVITQAMAGGAAAARAAVSQLGALLDRLQTTLRRGDLPELWFVGLGAPVPVERTVDLAALWRERVLPPLADDLTLHVTAAAGTIRGSSQRALDVAARALAERPFAPDGVLATSATGTLRFVASPGIAFGDRRLAARAPLPHEAHGVACAPLGDLARAAELDLAQLMARFWLRAAALHVDIADAIAPVAAPSAVDVDGIAAPTPAPSPSTAVSQHVERR